MNVAAPRSGADVWSAIRRARLSFGTSGQKVVLNGGLNPSILDGWWAEAYDGSMASDRARRDASG